MAKKEKLIEITPKAKRKKVPISGINDIAITTTAKSGEVVTFRAGKISFVMSQVEGCKIFCDNGLHVESKDAAVEINNLILHCYQCAERGFYEVLLPAEPNRKERRAAIAKAK